LISLALTFSCLLAVVLTTASLAADFALAKTGGSGRRREFLYYPPP
jgi:hypothetical protein